MITTAQGSTNKGGTHVPYPNSAMVKGITKMSDGSFFIDGQGLVLIGHNHSHAQARAAASKWLTGKGVSAFDAERLASAAPVNQGWYGGDAVGFVGVDNPDHPDPTAVTVVNLQTLNPGG